MLTRFAQLIRTASFDVLVALALTLATLAAVSAEVPPGTPPAANVASDDGLPGKGLPPSPGPNNPDGSSY